MTIVVRLDKRGRIMMPENIRRELGIPDRGYVIIEVEDDRLIMRPMKSAAGEFNEIIKIKEWPEDLDEYTSEVIQDWWKNVDVTIFFYWPGAHPISGEQAFQWAHEMEELTGITYYTSIMTLCAYFYNRWFNRKKPQGSIPFIKNYLPRNILGGTRYNILGDGR